MRLQKFNNQDLPNSDGKSNNVNLPCADIFMAIVVYFTQNEYDEIAHHLSNLMQFDKEFKQQFSAVNSIPNGKSYLDMLSIDCDLAEKEFIKTKTDIKKFAEFKKLLGLTSDLREMDDCIGEIRKRLSNGKKIFDNCCDSISKKYGENTLATFKDLYKIGDNSQAGIKFRISSLKKLKAKERECGTLKPEEFLAKVFLESWYTYYKFLSAEKFYNECPNGDKLLRLERLSHSKLNFDKVRWVVHEVYNKEGIFIIEDEHRTFHGITIGEYYNRKKSKKDKAFPDEDSVVNGVRLLLIDTPRNYFLTECMHGMWMRIAVIDEFKARLHIHDSRFNDYGSTACDALMSLAIELINTRSLNKFSISNSGSSPIAYFKNSIDWWMKGEVDKERFYSIINSDNQDRALSSDSNTTAYDMLAVEPTIVDTEMDFDFQDCVERINLASQCLYKRKSNADMPSFKDSDYQYPEDSQLSVRASENRMNDKYLDPESPAVDYDVYSYYVIEYIVNDIIKQMKEDKNLKNYFTTNLAVRTSDLDPNNTAQAGYAGIKIEAHNKVLKFMTHIINGDVDTEDINMLYNDSRNQNSNTANNGQSFYNKYDVSSADNIEDGIKFERLFEAGSAVRDLLEYLKVRKIHPMSIDRKIFRDARCPRRYTTLDEYIQLKGDVELLKDYSDQHYGSHTPATTGSNKFIPNDVLYSHFCIGFTDNSNVRVNDYIMKKITIGSIKDAKVLDDEKNNRKSLKSQAENIYWDLEEKYDYVQVARMVVSGKDISLNDSYEDIKSSVRLHGLRLVTTDESLVDKPEQVGCKIAGLQGYCANNNYVRSLDGVVRSVKNLRGTQTMSNCDGLKFTSEISMLESSSNMLLAGLVDMYFNGRFPLEDLGWNKLFTDLSTQEAGTFLTTWKETMKFDLSRKKAELDPRGALRDERDKLDNYVQQLTEQLNIQFEKCKESCEKLGIQDVTIEWLLQNKNSLWESVCAYQQFIVMGAGGSVDLDNTFVRIEANKAALQKASGFSDEQMNTWYTQARTVLGLWNDLLTLELICINGNNAQERLAVINKELEKSTDSLESSNSEELDDLIKDIELAFNTCYQNLMMNKNATESFGEMIKVSFRVMSLLDSENALNDIYLPELETQTYTKNPCLSVQLVSMYYNDHGYLEDADPITASDEKDSVMNKVASWYFSSTSNTRIELGKKQLNDEFKDLRMNPFQNLQRVAKLASVNDGTLSNYCYTEHGRDKNILLDMGVPTVSPNGIILGREARAKSANAAELDLILDRNFELNSDKYQSLELDNVNTVQYYTRYTDYMVAILKEYNYYNSLDEKTKKMYRNDKDLNKERHELVIRCETSYKNNVLINAAYNLVHVMSKMTKVLAELDSVTRLVLGKALNDKKDLLKNFNGICLTFVKLMKDYLFLNEEFKTSLVLEEKSLEGISDVVFSSRHLTGDLENSIATLKFIDNNLYHLHCYNLREIVIPIESYKKLRFFELKGIDLDELCSNIVEVIPIVIDQIVPGEVLNLCRKSTKKDEEFTDEKVRAMFLVHQVTEDYLQQFKRLFAGCGMIDERFQSLRVRECFSKPSYQVAINEGDFAMIVKASTSIDFINEISSFVNNGAVELQDDPMSRYSDRYSFYCRYESAVTGFDLNSMMGDDDWIYNVAVGTILKLIRDNNFDSNNGDDNPITYILHMQQLIRSKLSVDFTAATPKISSEKLRILKDASSKTREILKSQSEEIQLFAKGIRRNLTRKAKKTKEGYILKYNDYYTKEKMYNNRRLTFYLHKDGLWISAESPTITEGKLNSNSYNYVWLPVTKDEIPEIERLMIVAHFAEFK
jgi:hypothetical protein